MAPESCHLKRTRMRMSAKRLSGDDAQRECSPFDLSISHGVTAAVRCSRAAVWFGLAWRECSRACLCVQLLVGSLWLDISHGANAAV
eukprot:534042-Prymnesium_polylepis.1